MRCGWPEWGGSPKTRGLHVRLHCWPRQKRIWLPRRRFRFNSWVGIPWGRGWPPTPVLLPGGPVDRGARWATVHGVARVGHDWATDTFAYSHIHDWLILQHRRKQHHTVKRWYANESQSKNSTSTPANKTCPGPHPRAVWCRHLLLLSLALSMGEGGLEMWPQPQEVSRHPAAGVLCVGWSASLRPLELCSPSVRRALGSGPSPPPSVTDSPPWHSPECGLLCHEHLRETVCSRLEGRRRSSQRRLSLELAGLTPSAALQTLLALVLLVPPSVLMKLAIAVTFPRFLKHWKLYWKISEYCIGA